MSNENLPATINQERSLADPIQTRGLSLQTLEQMWQFAGYAHQSGLAPSALKSREACFVAIEMGAEVGLQPMSALQNIAVVNGRPSLWGDGMLAVCQARPDFDHEIFEEFFDGEPYKDNFKAVCIVGRKGAKPVRREFSVDDAKRAGLWGKSGPWSQYPKRMLQSRARSWGLRDAFSDALRGFRSAEEMREIIDVEVLPDSIAPVKQSAADKIKSIVEKEKPAEEPEDTSEPPTDIFSTDRLRPEKRAQVEELVSDLEALEKMLPEKAQEVKDRIVDLINERPEGCDRFAKLGDSLREEIVTGVKKMLSDAAGFTEDKWTTLPESLDGLSRNDAWLAIKTAMSLGELDAQYEEGQQLNACANSEKASVEELHDKEFWQYADKAWGRRKVK